MPKKVLDKNNIERSNRNLATLNMLNWFTHNSYLEIPMSQRMALYFDSRAQQALGHGLGNIGSGIGGILGGIGIGGLIGGMFGGPLGAIFGAVLTNLIGRSAVGKNIGNLLR